MIAKDLKKYLADVPDKAQVFIECDHGQNKENASSFVVSRIPINSCEDPDAMIFEWDNWKSVYDQDYVEDYDESAPVSAVLISY